MRVSPNGDNDMRFLSKKEVKRLTLYSDSQRARLEDAGSFPKRRRLGEGPRCRVGYPDVEVYQWMRSKGFPIHDNPTDIAP